MRCDCGREKTVSANALRRGKITSCGCGLARGKAISARLKSARRYIDLTGRTFGCLTAVEFLKSDFWRWQCSCGKIVDVRASAVKKGKVVSCGHVLSQVSKQKIENNIVKHFDGTAIPQITNIVNGKTRPNSTTGVTGVTFHLTRGGKPRYRARIVVRRREIYLGDFVTLEAAAAARKAAEEKYFRPIIERFETRREP